jgi:hypothetical protein
MQQRRRIIRMLIMLLGMLCYEVYAVKRRGMLCYDVFYVCYAMLCCEVYAVKRRGICYAMLRSLLSQSASSLC